MRYFKHVVRPCKMPLNHLLLHCLVSKNSINRVKNIISSADLGDPLADLLDDLLPDETMPESKSSTQRAKPEKSALSPSASPVLKTETRER